MAGDRRLNGGAARTYDFAAAFLNRADVRSQEKRKVWVWNANRAVSKANGAISIVMIDVMRRQSHAWNGIRPAIPNADLMAVVIALLGEIPVAGTACAHDADRLAAPFLARAFLRFALLYRRGYRTPDLPALVTVLCVRRRRHRGCLQCEKRTGKGQKRYRAEYTSPYHRQLR